METATFLVWLASLWLYAGAAVATAFLIFGIGRVDDSARGAYIFRPLIVPGILLLWPLVLWRWIRLETGWMPGPSRYRPVRSAHAPVWFMLAILIPAIFVVSLAVRQNWPTETGAVELPQQSR
ncbi:MAG: hypothetical protein ACR2PA_06370 [Hyphomicrobiaceae bacterium]